MITEFKRGLLAFDRGRPIQASLGDLNGKDAVLRMLTLDEGEFSFMASSDAGEQTMQGTVTGLLMEASRLQDEKG